MDDQSYSEAAESIAIIGMSGRFPKANNVSEYWENIKGKRDCISHFSMNELEIAPDFASVDKDAKFIAARGVMEHIEHFDTRFWGYTPKEASMMDPQQRVFLECAWEALEDSGYDADRYNGLIGCFAGCYIDTYLLANLCSDPHFLANLVKSIQVGTLQTELGNDKDYIATRAAFKMNLKGPAINVQTACSTSLVAITMACQSLLNYQSDMCLAGGATIALPQKKGYFYTEGGMLSVNGQCRAFDADATGTVFSNAAGAILLKRLSDAIDDNDHIYATIKGSALNNDGNDKQSFTAPSVQGQAEVIAMAHALADVDPRTIELIEAHGTATPLGDPIEIAGLTQAFRSSTDDSQFCAIGSAKTNIGHCDVASGVAGVIKTALALKEKVLPPSLHHQSPNAAIDFAKTPFYVNTELVDWPSREHPRRAGVSSFGVGGTNAHVVLEEYQKANNQESTKTHKLVTLSARSKTALDTYATNLSAFLESNECNLRDVAYTTQIGRKQFEHRAFFVANNNDSMISALKCYADSHQNYYQNRHHNPDIVFMFPGQGSQHPGMAKEIYQQYEEFRKAFDLCHQILIESVGIDLKQEVFNSTDPDQLKQTSIAQPSIFAVEYALAQLWISWGVKPQGFLGHSVGEYCAATLSGVMNLEDALRIVAKRGEFMQKMPQGSMLSVRATLDELQPWLDRIDIAAVNAPKLCVLSGKTEAISQIKLELDTAEIPCSLLHTSHAFHSEMMDEAIAPTIDIINSIHLQEPNIPIFSTVTGQQLSKSQAQSPDYWARNLRDTVNFSQATSAALDTSHAVFLEVGPGHTLSTLVNQVAQSSQDQNKVTSISSLPGSNSDESAEMTLLKALGKIWQVGIDIDWQSVSGPSAGRIPLPTYPFERKRYWVDPIGEKQDQDNNSQGHATPEHLDTESLIKQQLDVIAQQLKILKQ
ncbi:MAG: type I polyketide synthase [Pseudomonadales bacterium]|nr:type I polyketide synthase [Pseudomonadales bacterium]